MACGREGMPTASPPSGSSGKSLGERGPLGSPGTEWTESVLAAQVSAAPPTKTLGSGAMPGLQGQLTVNLSLTPRRSVL